jgi:hypothetical protein
MSESPDMGHPIWWNDELFAEVDGLDAEEFG